MCDVIFGQIQPSHVMITTPNQEFNVYFNFKVGQMRHLDHKFEWNRLEFQQFCDSVVKKFNGYQY